MQPMGLILDGFDSETKCPSRRQKLERGRAREALGSDQWPSEARLDHWRSCSHGLNLLIQQVTRQGVTTHSGVTEELEWLSTYMLQSKFKVVALEARIISLVELPLKSYLLS
ncbi:hypothetical protein Lal_00032926 [Lupinus albus]|nr:hypothetical protein Lal_00032926 [Lupinus albus]